MEIVYEALLLVIITFSLIGKTYSVSHSKRLYIHLTQHYRSTIIPVRNDSDFVEINIGLDYIRVDIDEKNQIMTSDVWFHQEWIDYRLKWDPEEFDNQKVFYLPIDDIWIPEIVLYNTADGKYEPSMVSKATIHFNGTVVWRSPTIFKSFCMIDVEYFPFDEQLCLIKFSSWIYDGMNVRIKHRNSNEKKINIYLTDTMRQNIRSNEWDLRRIGAVINSDFINSNNESRPYIKFFVKLRRKCFFHIINLVIPCIGLTLMTVVVFYLSSESNEKITLSISILMALTLFFLILIETMPPTSMSIPLLGKFLLFTLAMVSLSICATIYVLRVHHRDPRLHSRMSERMRNYFFNYLPKFLHTRRTSEYLNGLRSKLKNQELNNDLMHHKFFKNNLKNLIAVKLVDCLNFFFNCIESDARERQIREEWKYFAIVLDRIFIYVFGIAFIFGTCSIFLMNASNGSDDIHMDF